MLGRNEYRQLEATLSKGEWTAAESSFLLRISIRQYTPCFAQFVRGKISVGSHDVGRLGKGKDDQFLKKFVKNTSYGNDAEWMFHAGTLSMLRIRGRLGGETKSMSY